MNLKSTKPELIDTLINAVTQWTNDVEVQEPMHVDPDIYQAFYEQQEIGWHNLLLGVGTKKWADCQQRHYESLGRRNTGKRWLVELQKLLINTSWDLWYTRCHERWKPGNCCDQQAESALDAAITNELALGLTDSFPLRSRHLLENNAMDVMTLSLQSKKYWLQSVESARSCGSPVAIDDQPSVHAPERTMLRQWLQTGRF